MDDQAVSSRSAIELTADVISAFVSNNSVSRSVLPRLISGVHAALQDGSSPNHTQQPKPAPAVPVKKSITVDFLISLEDGKPYKSLKRHLTRLGLTPQQYREKWSLPANYPMVAPNYAAQRSELAKSSGLGRKPKSAAKSAAPSPKIAAPAAKKPRRKKVR
ncbi:MucR family transcriptional regulator [Microvirga massiliensis]|uniref:MucR family transcriptional regulator n=1 Tax=Microvirga massiliensis TaxID=1033741 RepID=UPI000A93B818|nr:MucR family transcriptional regulator [Microvirga massiliensis]